MPELPRGVCPACAETVSLRKGGLTREHRLHDLSPNLQGAPGDVCEGSGKMALAEGETPTIDRSAQVTRRKGETVAAWRKRLEAAGHRLTGSRANPTHDLPNCEVCKAIDAPVTHPATGEWIEPSLEQQAIAAERPDDAWSGAEAASLSPWDLDPDPDNARGDDYGDLAELAASLITEGMLQPIVVYATGGRHRIVAGHRRVAAARMANLAAVPCLVRPDLDSAMRLAAVQATENLQRRNLNPLQEAKAYRRLADAGAKQDEIAARVGVNQGHISKRLSLLKLTPDAQDHVAAGTITIEDAVEVARLPKAAQPLAITYLLSTNPRNAVARAKGDHEREVERQAVVDRLAADGVTVIEWPGYSWSYDDGVPLAVGGTRPMHVYAAAGVLELSPAKHKRCPGHVATIDPNGDVLYLCTDPARHDIPTVEERRSAQQADREAQDAERAERWAEEAAAYAGLRAATVRVAGGKIARPAMADFLADAVLLSFADETVTPVAINDDHEEAMVLLEVLTGRVLADAENAAFLNDDALTAAVDALVDVHGPLKIAFVSTLLSTVNHLARPIPPWSNFPGHRLTRAFFELLQTHAGYELTDRDEVWLDAPLPSWSPEPMPEPVDPEAVAWYVGNPDDELDVPRWIYDAAEADAMVEMVADRVLVVTASEVTEDGDHPPLSEVTSDQAEPPQPGDRCPGSGRDFNSPGNASAYPCPLCSAPVATSAKGKLAEHLIPFADELVAVE